MRSRRVVPHRSRLTNWSKPRRYRCGSRTSSMVAAGTRSKRVRALYWSSTSELFVVDDTRLDHTTERHKFNLKPTPLQGGGTVMAALQDASLHGLVLEMFLGW